MDRIVLPNGRPTSRVGFGCGSLRGGGEADTSRALIKAALDAGISHFDLAPSYGHGLAEEIAGRVLRPLRREVTITTKVGIARPRIPGLLTGLRRLAKPVVSRIPWLWSSIASSVRRSASTRGCFESEFVRSSVAESLKLLRTDAIDILLMHEMVEGNANAELSATLGELVASGCVGALGTGGDRDEARRIAARMPTLGQVSQFRWSVLEAPLPTRPDHLLITYGAIGGALTRVTKLLVTQADKAAGWSAILDADLANPRELCDLLLGAALAENAHGIVLVGSQDPVHIRRAAAVAADRDLIARASRLHALVREDLAAGSGAGVGLGGMLLDGGGRP